MNQKELRALAANLVSSHTAEELGGFLRELAGAMERTKGEPVSPEEEVLRRSAELAIVQASNKLCLLARICTHRNSSDGAPVLTEYKNALVA